MAYALPIIPAEAWNRTLAELARQINLSVGWRSRGGDWRHPWHLAARWDSASQRWLLSVAAGFVNAAETNAPPVPFAAAPAATRERLAASSGGPVRPWLTESPWFPAPPRAWRAIGPDADAVTEPEPVPEFFQALGVGGPPRLEIEADLSGLTVTGAGALGAEGVRRLRAVDVVLAIPKPAPGFSLTEGGDGVSRLDVALNFPAPDARPAVFPVRRWTPPADSGSTVAELLTGQASRSVLEMKVGTVFLLSPPGAPGGDPGADWLPFVSQSLFWNLAFSWRTLLESVPRMTFTFVSGLAGGAADPIFQSILAPRNEAEALQAALLSRGEVETSAWSV